MAETKSKKKKSPDELREELRNLGRSDRGGARPTFDLKKIALRVGGVLAILWVVALFIPSWIPKAICALLTALAVGLGVWLVRHTRRTAALTALLEQAGTKEGRKEVLARLDTDFKKGDVQATIAKAQLVAEENPKEALVLLEQIDLGKQLGPAADQIRSMRASIHLNLGETMEARQLVDAMEVGKQQETKTRAIFATVAAEAWGRTGQAKKAVELIELFNPDDPEFSDLKINMWRARAFAYAGHNDLKGASRALRRLFDVNPHLVSMFLADRKVHPYLQKEARELAKRGGLVQQKMVRQRM